MAQQMTVPAVRARKASSGADPLVMLTAYDAPGARMVDQAGADLILVGDSVAMVVLGYDDTLQVTVDDIAHHTAAVARTRPDALVVADMPWMSYHVSVGETVQNAATLIRAGAQAVKLEGGRRRLPMIEALVGAEIPVMGHIGLTPQSMHAMGGFKVQGRSEAAAERLMQDALAVQEAGAYSMVLEGIPKALATRISEALDIPTIGIGAGPHCDGQILVTPDMLGIYTKFRPRFVRLYAELGKEMRAAFESYSKDVKELGFPTTEESY